MKVETAEKVGEMRAEVNETASAISEAKEAKKEEKAPGFEGVLAVTGLLGAAFLVLGRRT